MTLRPLARVTSASSAAAAACSNGSPPRNVTPCTCDVTMWERRVSESMSRPPRADHICGLKQPAQRMVQPCTQMAKRRPGPSALVPASMRATRKGDVGSEVKDATWPGLLHMVGGGVNDDVRLQLDQLMGLEGGGGD